MLVALGDQIRDEVGCIFWWNATAIAANINFD
jgi:hypothetical protein